MADNPRIEELRRRVQNDPASIAFAQLAEEFRRAGEYEQAADVCRAGLARHPTYLSARVTLGRALIELGQLDEAQSELDHVLKSAPENLAAIRGLGEIHQRRGDLASALRLFQTALGIARHDPELEESVHDLTRRLGSATADRGDAAPETAAPVPSFDAPPPASPPRPGEEQAARPAASLSPELEAAADEFTKALQALDSLTLDLSGPSISSDVESAEPHEEATPPAPQPEVERSAVPAPADPAAAELESWLEAIVQDRGRQMDARAGVTLDSPDARAAAGADSPGKPQRFPDLSLNS